MAKGGIPDIFLYGALAVGGYLAYKEGLLTEPIAAGQQLVDELFSKLKEAPGLARLKDGTTAPEEGTGAAAPGGSATGSCVGGPYKGTGKTVSCSKNGPKTRHYASGKPDDKTVEMNAKSISFQNYQFVNYVTMNSIEHDDTVSVKYGGTHMGSGWYDHGISFNSGQGCLGSEKKHPSANLCVVKGKSIGKIVGRKIGIAGVIFSASGGGGKTELWADAGAGGWQKLAEGVNVDNFKPNASSDEAQLRIDGFEKEPTIHCSVVQEIAAGSSTFGGTQAPFTAKQALVEFERPLAIHQECGIVCADEYTSIADLAMIQRGFNR